MSEEACIKRQKRAEKKGWVPNQPPPDPGCIGCEQGKKIMEGEGRDEIKDEHRTSNIEHRTSNKKTITHTCRTKGCGHTGPLVDFVKNKASKDGRTNECKKCQSKRSAANLKKRRQKIQAEERVKILKEQEDKVEGKRPKAEGNEKTLLIDLSDHPELFAKIIKKAKDEIRTPEAQVLYQLKKTNYQIESGEYHEA
ncbi:MAG: hypothetical protein JRD05_00610 [Deltaproteobacteria bacterium]|nr:hypothetical protein [Deltaproteobacteria bacterium]